MKLTEYFATDILGAKGEMARFLGITPTWMSLLLSGKRRCSPILAIEIEKATKGLVSRRDMRPDLYE